MKKDYILITPVHNEAKYIESAIESVAAQTIPPKKWVIVDDRSTDRTFDIIKKYEQRYDFIESHQAEGTNTEHDFARRTKAFVGAYGLVKNLKFDFVGSLDADITLEPTYYECILREFDKNPQLGIASGIYADKLDSGLRRAPIDRKHCPGALQLVRCECYETIGGYIPLKHGGDDSCAEIMARMNGWQTRSFPEYVAIHHRPVGTGDGTSVLRARFRQGLTEYGVATHPVFLLAKSIRRAFLEKPYILAGLARLMGFLYGYWLREERRIPEDVAIFVRKEQIRRIFTN